MKTNLSLLFVLLGCIREKSTWTSLQVLTVADSCPKPSHLTLSHLIKYFVVFSMSSTAASLTSCRYSTPSFCDGRLQSLNSSLSQQELQPPPSIQSHTPEALWDTELLSYNTHDSLQVLCYSGRNTSFSSPERPDACVLVMPSTSCCLRLTNCSPSLRFASYHLHRL